MARHTVDRQAGTDQSLAPAAEVLARIIEMGITTPAKIARDGARLYAASSRHSSYRVENRRGRGWFVKQGDGKAGFGTVAHEALAYRALKAIAPAAVRPRLPNLVAYDRAKDLLVLELISGSQDLSLDSGEAALGPFAQALGRALAALHSTDPNAARSMGLPVHSGARVLSFDAPALHHFVQFSRAQIELVTALQAHPPLMAELREIARRWRPDRVVHFDVRLSNALLNAEGLVLIDFEFLGIGDPRWDLGCLVAAVLETWILSAPLGDHESYQHHLHLARFDKEKAQQAIREALRGYHATPAAPEISPEDVARFAGVRLIHGAFEHAADDLETTARVASLAAFGADLLADPAEAAYQTLGLSRPSLTADDPA